MQKKRKMLPRLAAVVTVLMFLNLFTFVLTAQAILQICDTTPTAEVSLNVEASAVPVTEATLPAAETAPPATAPAANTQTSAQPGGKIYDDDKTWGDNTEIEIFHARYDNATGEVTVYSADGDNLIAPGTEDQYYFHIKNTGNTSLKYEMKAQASVHFTVNDEDLELPLNVRFSDHKGTFHVGGEDFWESVEALDGVTDKAVLSANHYAKYTLEWQWPFEGDDELDTILGNMAADGDEISVKIAFSVRAEADTGSGGLPQTGDTSNIALWAGLCVCSGFALVIILFTWRKEEKDEKG